MNDLDVLDELLAIEAEWGAASVAEGFRRRRMLEAPQMIGPHVWSLMAACAVDPIMHRVASRALVAAAHRANVHRLPMLTWFSGESELVLVRFRDDDWTTAGPIESWSDFERWEVRLHIDADLADVARLVDREVQTLKQEALNVPIAP